MHYYTIIASTASGFAYLDGGTGSMILQAALAGILTGAYALKGQFANLKAKILGIGKNKAR